ncbi:MAG: hypothetical protein C4346_13360 [Chloroflexota bacterium]
MAGRAPILIIDDDPLARELLSRRLHAAGYEVLLEAEGGAGLWRAKRERPDLIICDLHLPLAPGELVILALRDDPTTASIPLLILRADPGRLGPEHRLDAVLAKPVDAPTLLATIWRWLGEGFHPVPTG